MSETWGKGAKNNTIGYGQGSVNNTINWGKSQKDSSVSESWSGDTNISGSSGNDPIPFRLKLDVTAEVQKTTTIFRIRKTGADVVINWGDGATTTLTAAATSNVSHTYNDGNNTDVTNPIVNIGAEESGVLTEIYYKSGTGNPEHILEIQQWGTKHSFTSLNFSFATQMQITATDNLTTTTLSNTFKSCTAMTGNSSMNNWNTSNVTGMNSAFQSCTNFSTDLYNWDTSSVTTVGNMFYLATNFNGNINGWDLRNCNNMTYMLAGGSSNKNIFNKPLNNWLLGTTNKSMANMFNNTSNFNQDITGWDVTKVTSMNNMFNSSQSFNQNLSSWVLTNCTTALRMFFLADNFNQDLGSMTLGASLTDVNYMFYFGATTNENYTSTIVGWANQVFSNSAPYNVNGANLGTKSPSRSFDNSASGGANFADAGAARDYLTGATAGWTITGDTRIN
jgi:hypothetical protein